MNFLEAVNLMQKGKKVRRKQWESFNTAITFRYGKLVEAGSLQKIEIGSEDYRAEDWEIKQTDLLEEKSYSVKPNGTKFDTLETSTEGNIFLFRDIINAISKLKDDVTSSTSIDEDEFYSMIIESFGPKFSEYEQYTKD